MARIQTALTKHIKTIAQGNCFDICVEYKADCLHFIAADYVKVENEKIKKENIKDEFVKDEKEFIFKEK